MKAIECFVQLSLVIQSSILFKRSAISENEKEGGVEQEAPKIKI